MNPVLSVAALILNSQGEILLLKTHKWKDKYGLAAGKVEEGESTKDAIIREVKEETNLDVYDVSFLLNQELIYPEEFYRREHFFSLIYECKTKDTLVTLNEEAQSYEWVTPKKALEYDLNTPTRELIEYYLQGILHVTNLAVKCIIGVHEHEKKIAQPLIIDLQIKTDTKTAAKTDQLSDALDYDSLVTEIKDICSKPHELLESLAEDIATNVKNKGAFSVRVCINKPNALKDADTTLCITR